MDASGDRAGAVVLRGELWLVLGAFALLCGLRLLQLDSDPPFDVHYHFITDEGWWAHNAKLRVAFGSWVMDEHNPPLLTAPFYTLVLAGVYGTFGVGLVQTRLLAAFSGVAVCLLVWGVTRALASPLAALLALVFTGFGYFMLSLNRVGFVESFQLVWLTAALLGLAVSVGRPTRAAIAGGCFALAVLSKLTAAPFALVPLLFFALEWARPRDASAGSTGWSRIVAPALAFGVSGGAIAGVVALAWVVPHFEWVRAGLFESTGAVGGGNPVANLGVLGLDPGRGAERVWLVGGFATQTVLLLAAVALAAALRGAVGSSQPRSALARACACWLAVGALAIGVQDIHPDRRYLALVPPLAIVAALWLASGALALPARDRVRGYRAFALGAVGGAFAGLYLRPLAIDPIQTLAERIPLGDTEGLEAEGAALVAWIGFTLAGAALGPLLVRLLPNHARRVPVAGFVSLFLLLGLGRFALHAASPGYSVRDARDRIAEITESWPPETRVALGDTADTLTLGTGVFPFIIRNWDDVGMYMNLDGRERFGPRILLDEEPTQPGFERVTELELCRDRNGEPRFRVPLLVRRPEGAGP